MGFHLLFDQFESIRHRIDIGSVTQVGDVPGYDDKSAVVPAGDWRPLTEGEAEQFRADETTPPGLVVKLVTRPLPVSPGADLDERRQAAAALDPLDGQWPHELLACADSPAGCLTTTLDFDNGRRRIGLHIDNFDRLPYSERLRSRRRLALNMGPGSRYLLLGDRTIMDICGALGRDQDGHLPHTDDLRRYIAEGHPLRCLRIRLEPGQGYIAPTELLPHDGSTAGAAEWSVVAFWLGPPS
ncbi:hypothetical protein [Microbispora sp. GKU 823]|uniref:hypothetical protein n=1 Tax=Microbispora sp. GKU 823 TaxID=1652100 RepID=UPI0009A2FDD6|nr:hypothetical protein [Microbispora sp. GKU 823]OPG10587.1 hypothetical protein B1L11_23295 [Microbispora sp. GKU 823]